MPSLVGSIPDDDWKDVCAHKSSDLAHGRSVRVVLTTNCGGAGLGCTQTDVVTGTEFAEREEDTNRIRDEIGSSGYGFTYP